MVKELDFQPFNKAIEKGIELDCPFLVLQKKGQQLIWEEIKFH